MALINNSADFVAYELKRDIVFKDILELKKQLLFVIKADNANKKTANINYITKMGIINSVFFNNNNDLKIDNMSLPVMQNYSNLLYEVISAPVSSDYTASKIALKYRNLVKKNCNHRYPEQTAQFTTAKTNLNYAKLNALYKKLESDTETFSKINIYNDYSEFYNNYLLTEHIKDNFNKKVNFEMERIETGYNEEKENIIKKGLKNDIAFRLEECEADCSYEKKCVLKTNVNNHMLNLVKEYKTKLNESEINAVNAKLKK